MVKLGSNQIVMVAGGSNAASPVRFRACLPLLSIPSTIKLTEFLVLYAQSTAMGVKSVFVQQSQPTIKLESAQTMKLEAPLSPSQNISSPGALTQTFTEEDVLPLG